MEKSFNVTSLKKISAMKAKRYLETYSLHKGFFYVKGLFIHCVNEWMTESLVGGINASSCFYEAYFIISQL